MSEKRVFEGVVRVSRIESEPLIEELAIALSQVRYTTNKTWLGGFENKRVRLTVEVLEEEKSDG